MSENKFTKARIKLNTENTNSSTVEATDEKSGLKGKLRMLFQGLSLGSGDEIEAYLRSFGEEDYEEALKQIRGSIAEERIDHPIASLVLEGLGAVAPTILTGGGGAALTAGRLAARGAIGGSVYGFNTGEDGALERAKRIPGGAAGGAVGNVLGDKAVKVAGAGAKAIMDRARLMLGRRASNIVNNEAQRIALKTGQTTDEVLQDIYDGKIMAENESLRAVMKDLRSKPGGEQITNTLKTRPEETRKVAIDEVEKSLGGSNNLALADEIEFRKQVKAKEKEVYEPFKTGEVNAVVLKDLEDAIEQVPDVAKPLLKKLQARKGRQKPLLKKKSAKDGGGYEFLRRPTPEEAEQIRRGLDAVTTKEFRKDGGGFVGEAYQEVAQDVRASLDENIEGLASARAQVKAMRDNKDAFDKGRKYSAGQIDEKIIELENIIAETKTAKDPEAIKNAFKKLNAYKSGFLSALQAKFMTTQAPKTVRDLAVDNDKAGIILRMVLPDETLEGVIKKLEVATGSEAANRQILKGTLTPESLNEGAQSGLRGLIPRIVGGSMTMNPGMVVGQVADAITSKFGRGLTEAETRALSEIVTSTDPQIVRRALVDDSVLAQLQGAISSRVNRAATPMGSATGQIYGARQGANTSQGILGSGGR